MDQTPEDLNRMLDGITADEAGRNAAEGLAALGRIVPGVRVADIRATSVFSAESMDTIMGEGIARRFDTAEAAADNLAETMRMHGWTGDTDDVSRRLLAGETIEHGRWAYGITKEP